MSHGNVHSLLHFLMRGCSSNGGFVPQAGLFFLGIIVKGLIGGSVAEIFIVAGSAGKKGPHGVPISGSILGIIFIRPRSSAHTGSRRT